MFITTSNATPWHPVEAVLARSRTPGIDSSELVAEAGTVKGVRPLAALVGALASTLMFELAHWLVSVDVGELQATAVIWTGNGFEFVISK
jgi:hypothetical protein